MTANEKNALLADTLRDVGALATVFQRPGLELSAEFLRAAFADVARVVAKRLAEAEAGA